MCVLLPPCGSGAGARVTRHSENGTPRKRRNGGCERIYGLPTSARRAGELVRTARLGSSRKPRRWHRPQTLQQPVCCSGSASQDVFTAATASRCVDPEFAANQGICMSLKLHLAPQFPDKHECASARPTPPRVFIRSERLRRTFTPSRCSQRLAVSQPLH